MAGVWPTRIFFTNGLNLGLAEPSADSLNLPYGVAVSSIGVWISERDGNRILGYSGSATTATQVFGQAGKFSTSNLAVGPDALRNPYGISLNGSDLLVADTGNNRVLLIDTLATVVSPGISETGTSFAGNLTLMANSTLLHASSETVIVAGQFTQT